MIHCTTETLKNYIFFKYVSNKKKKKNKIRNKIKNYN